MIIMDQDTEAASASNILQTGRLQTLPRGGFITFELQATVASTTNNHRVTILLPDGGNPLDSVMIPAGSVAGAIDELQAMKLRFKVQQGGHLMFNTVLTGASILSWRVVFNPFR